MITSKDDKELLSEQHLSTFKNALKGMIAASKEAYQKTDNKYSSSRQKIYTRDDINQIISRGNPIEKAALSEYFFTINGLYKRVILHYATFLTYSWILVPYMKNKKYKISDSKNAQTYFDAADFCTTFQIERKCAAFAKEVLVKGAYYGLLHDDGERVVIQDLPFDFCRSRFKNADDIDIVEFNMAFFDTIRDEELRNEILKTYPKIIEKAYKNYKHRNGRKWIYLPAEMGIYFCYLEERPFFLDLIPLLDDLEDYKAIDKARNVQALKKILVQQVGVDGLKLVFQPAEAEQMHEGALEMLANNQDIDVITTYNKIDLLDLNSESSEKTEVQDVQNLIYESAGLSKEFFFSTTEAGLNYSTYNDLAMMMVLGQNFAHFFTALLNYKFETKKVKFKFIILPLSYYNSADYTSRSRELASFGYSFLNPILSTGIDQTNLVNLKTLEYDVLHLDKVLKPLQSSYTQSGKAQGEPMSDNNSTSNTDNLNDNNNQEENKEKENEEGTEENNENRNKAREVKK